MINFPYSAKYTYLVDNNKVAKNLKLLEKTLRKLGKFHEKKPIEIFDFHMSQTYLDTIYEVRDLDNTLFEFYNYSLGSRKESQKRYSMNSYLTMKRENSKLTYKYDFSEMEYDDHKQGLRIIEVSCPVTEKRVLKLEIKKCQPIKLMIEEDFKKYVIGFNQSTEEEYKVLEEISDLIEKVSKIDKLNLEKVSLLIDNKKISYANISINNQIVATVAFNQGNIYKYEIRESDKKINGEILGKINRKVERTLEGKISKYSEEITEDKYYKLQSDYKRLFKQL